MSVNEEKQKTPEVVPKTPQNDENEGTFQLKMTQLENDLKQKEDVISTLKGRVGELEKEVAEALKFKAQQQKEAEEITLLKEKSEDTLTRAKEIIFERTKVIKNQELQIEALNQQISSLKDVVTITKDLLEIRNMETKQLEAQIQIMDAKIQAERERQELVHKKLENMIRYNGELKREYETQLCLFAALRERYNEKELAKGVLDTARANAAGNDDPAAPSTSSSGDSNQINGEEQK